MKVLYFAWVRTKIGVGSEIVGLEKCEANINTVRTLVEHLRGRGDNYTDAFLNLKGMRVAINQEFSNFDASIKETDEVAFFPPVTGG